MFNFDSVKFELIFRIIELTILSLVFFLIGKEILFKKVWENDRKFKKVTAYILAIVLLVSNILYSSFFYYSVFIKKEIGTYTGIFKYDERGYHAGLTMSYYFSDDLGNTDAFDLKSIFAKDIIGGEFEKESKYKIYYTEFGSQIIKVEKLN